MYRVPYTPISYLSQFDFERASEPVRSDQILRLVRAMRAASRKLEEKCGRIFYELAGFALELPVERRGQVSFPLPLDVISITSVKNDTAQDLTFTEDLVADASKTLVLIPENEPHTDLEIRHGGPGAALGERRLRVLATWGWRSYTLEDTGDTIEDNPLAADLTATTVTLNDSERVWPGELWRVDTEDMVLERRLSAKTVQVQRAVGGSTLATHAQNVQIDRVVWDDTLRQACEMVAAKLWKMADTGWAPVLSDSGPTLEADRIFDRRVMEIITELRRL